MSVGHDEYWSGTQRANVEAARAAGVNMVFLSGNEVFWKTRWEPSVDGSNTARRTLVTYKETHANAVIDPQDPPTWTGTWRDKRFSPPADGGRPEHSLTGQLFRVNDGSTTSIIVPEAQGKMRLWRHTTIATLAPGATATLPNGTLGYEWDEAPQDNATPPGLIRLSTTTRSVTSLLLDNGSTYGAGTATHTLTLYRHPSGAQVFGAGTVQWSWGLDNNHDRGSTAADSRMKQATANLLADMGVQADSLEAGLTDPTPSSDVLAPTAVITPPSAGASIPAGPPINIAGTAARPAAHPRRRQSVDRQRRDLAARHRHHELVGPLECADPGRSLLARASTTAATCRRPPRRDGQHHRGPGLSVYDLGAVGRARCGDVVIRSPSSSARFRPTWRGITGIRSTRPRRTPARTPAGSGPLRRCSARHLQR